MKIWGLFIGEKLIRTSKKRTDLVEERNRREKEGAYIALYLGRLDKDMQDIYKKENTEGEEDGKDS